MDENHIDNEKIIKNIETYQKNKKEKITKFMLDTLQEMFSCLRYPKFKFSLSGILTSIIIIIITGSFFILPFLISPDEGLKLASFNIPPNLIGIPISLILAFIIIFIWFILGLRITPKAAHYLVDNKVLKLIFTRGDVHYLEYIPEKERKISMPHILNKFISLLIAWVSLSAFMINLIAAGNPVSIINGKDIFSFVLRSFILFILVPLIFTLIYPLSWMLMDAKLKAFNSSTKINWLIGKKVADLMGGIITFGSLFALGADMISAGVITRFQLIVDLLLFCIINTSMVVILISVFYNIFFQGRFYQIIMDSIEIGFGITSVTLKAEKGIEKEEKILFQTNSKDRALNRNENQYVNSNLERIPSEEIKSDEKEKEPQ